MSSNAPIGITVGDPAGIGPEILNKALDEPGMPDDVCIYGPDCLVEELARRRPCCTARPTSTGLAGVEMGRYSRESGAASVNALEAAMADLASGASRALVTGPISKLALADAGLPYPGQTEMAASFTEAKRFAMMLAGPRLRVALATTHIAIKDVPHTLSRQSIMDATELTHDFLLRILDTDSPRIAVLGLNPHASDNGRFGTEEAEIIGPAVDTLRSRGIQAFGPLPADTAFHKAAGGEFDAVVAMYHDQGLGPLKLLHFSSAVNITLGLPRPRCSPDHGPAFDLAGREMADPASMIAAIRFADEAS